MLAPVSRGAAQAVTVPAGARASTSCDGAIVSAIDIRAHQPLVVGVAAEALDKTERAAGVRFATTHADVIRAYLRVAVGERCTERDRSESERLLRAQPFIAQAGVRAVPDGPGRVRLLVDVVDELPVIVGGSLGQGTLKAVELGTQNLSGRGLMLVAHYDRGFAYRDGFGARAVQYGAFGGPDYIALSAERRTLGEALSVEVAQPFLTDLQRTASHASVNEASYYAGVVRPDGPDVALYTRRLSYDVGWVARLAHRNGRGTVGLVGGAILGEDVRTGPSSVIVSDSGVVMAPVPELGVQYGSYGVTRVAAIGGLRSLRFLTVRGFDALRARQDVGIGIQLDLLAGASVLATPGASDVFAAGDLYAGGGDEDSFFAARLLGEGRENHGSGRRDGVVASGRFSWYARATPGRTTIMSVDASAVQHLAFPVQLTFRDYDGGLLGFPGATSAGGQRVVARVEERGLIRLFTDRADFAVAAFADAGKLWAGDVPFGATTGIHSSVGFSLLGTYPTGGKRIYRMDLAVPLNPQRGGSRFAVRFSSGDRTGLLWLEPGDVSRARTGAVPANLMKW